MQHPWIPPYHPTPPLFMFHPWSVQSTFRIICLCLFWRPQGFETCQTSPGWVLSRQQRDSKRRWTSHTFVRTESRSLNIVRLQADVPLAALLSPLIFSKATKTLVTSETSPLQPTRCPWCPWQQNMPHADNTSHSVWKLVTRDPQIEDFRIECQ